MNHGNGSTISQSGRTALTERAVLAQTKSQRKKAIILTIRTTLLAAALALAFATTTVNAADALQSWNEGNGKQSIMGFVKRVTAKGGKDFVPPAERIAVFDNDGTLWAEQPVYFQLAFALDRVKVLAPQHPEWKDREPFSSLLKGDLKGALAGGEQAIAQIVMATHAGMTKSSRKSCVTGWRRRSTRIRGSHTS